MHAHRAAGLAGRHRQASRRAGASSRCFVAGSPRRPDGRCHTEEPGDLQVDARLVQGDSRAAAAAGHSRHASHVAWPVGSGAEQHAGGGGGESNRRGRRRVRLAQREPHEPQREGVSALFGQLQAPEVGRLVHKHSEHSQTRTRRRQGLAQHKQAENSNKNNYEW